MNPSHPTAKQDDCGGSAVPIRMAEMPVGIAGVPGICRFVILEDPLERSETPPLVPIKLWNNVDLVIEPNTE